MSYVLDVYYDCDDAEDMPAQDSRADEAAGRAHVGGGFNLATNVRDREYRFETEADMNAAKERLHDAGFRFFP